MNYEDKYLDELLHGGGLMTVGRVLKSKSKPVPVKKRWLGSKPERCDICHSTLKKAFVDGATFMGPWAIMCRICHANIGTGFGTGCGQVYDLETLEKIGG